MNYLEKVSIDKLLSKTDLQSKGKLFGKVAAFASQLSSKLGSEDDSVEVDYDDTYTPSTEQGEQGEQKGLFGPSKKEKEAAAEAAKKAKQTMMIGIVVALVALVFIFKKK